MAHVTVIDIKTGKPVKMARRYAEILVKMKRAKYPEAPKPLVIVEIPEEAPAGFVDIPCTAVLPPPISPAVRDYALENGIDPESITGTGKDGRINRKDVEAAIIKASEE